MRTSIRKILLAVGFFVIAPLAVAAGYPSKPIKLIVPYPPGGTSEVLARGLARSLGERLGQPVVIENMGGAGSTLGSAKVARSDPDGYTLLLGYSSGLTIAPSFNSEVPYDTLKAFTPIRSVASFPMVMVANSKLPAKNLDELVAVAKQRPGKITYGTPGVGTSIHLIGEFLRTTAGVDILQVPYKGMAPAINDFRGGRVDLIWDAIDNVRALIQDGTARPLAVTSTKRLKDLPNVPTVAEQGYPDLTFSVWTSIVAPAGIPPDIAKKLEDELGKVLASPEVHDQIESRGFEVMNGSAASLGALMKDELARNKEVVRAANAGITKQ